MSAAESDDNMLDVVNHLAWGFGLARLAMTHSKSLLFLLSEEERTMASINVVFEGEKKSLFIFTSIISRNDVIPKHECNILIRYYFLLTLAKSFNIIFLVIFTLKQYLFDTSWFETLTKMSFRIINLVCFVLIVASFTESHPVLEDQNDSGIVLNKKSSVMSK